MKKKVLAFRVRNVVFGSALGIGMFFIGEFTGRITAPRPTVYDISTGKQIPLVAPNGAEIVVVSPEGLEPGTETHVSKDGKYVYIFPPSLLQDQSPDPSPDKSQPDQTDRLDHADKF